MPPLPNGIGDKAALENFSSVSALDCGQSCFKTNRARAHDSDRFHLKAVIDFRQFCVGVAPRAGLASEPDRVSRVPSKPCELEFEQSAPNR